MSPKAILSLFAIQVLTEVLTFQYLVAAFQYHDFPAHTNTSSFYKYIHLIMSYLCGKFSNAPYINWGRPGFSDQENKKKIN